MADLQALRAELDAGHPDTGAYDASAVTAAEQVNALNRTQNRDSMTGSEILNAVVVSEYTALMEADKDRLWDLLGLGTLDPFGVEATLLTSLFGGGSATIVALAAARKLSVSRAEELGLGKVAAGTVEQARAL